MRPEASVSGTRWTRCTPDSNLSLANTPRPRTSATISLKPPFVPSLSERISVFQPCVGGITFVHAEKVPGEQRGFVAAGTRADFEDRIVIVHRILWQQSETNLLCQGFLAFLQFAPFVVRKFAHLRVRAGIIDQRGKLERFRCRCRDRL